MLDASRGGPLHPAARAALDAVGTAGWSDPRTASDEGRRASALRSAATESVASTVGGRPDLLLWEPGADRALADGAAGLLAGQRSAGYDPVLVLCAVDHDAVHRVARWWTSTGGRVVEVGVDRLGRLDAEAMVAAASEGSGAVVCLQLANGEVGTLQPAVEVLTALTDSGTEVLLDATACVGRIPIPPGWSALAIDAVSWGGPRGVAALLRSPRSSWRRPQPDVRDEPPVALIVAAASALEAVQPTLETTAATARHQIDRIRTSLEALPDRASAIDVPGDPEQRLPHVLTVSALYVDGESLAAELDRRGVAVGSGSACASDSGQPSHVLAAMGALTGGNVRICLPIGATDDDVDAFIAAYPDSLTAVRQTVGMTGEATGQRTEQSAGQPTPGQPEPDVWIDERGSRCPAPVISLARAAFTRPAGTVVAVMASDPAAATDIPAWCRLRGAEYLGTREPRDGGEGRAYVVRLTDSP